MNRMRRIFLSFVAVLSLFVLCARAEEKKVTIIPVAENLYLLAGIEGGNVAFLLTDKEAIVIDTGEAPRWGKLIVEAVKEMTGKPIGTVVLTHYHGDHVGGLQSFPESADIIGHDNMAEQKLRKTNEAHRKENIEKRYPEYIDTLKKNIEKLKAEKSPDLAKAEGELVSMEADFAEYKTMKVIYPDITFSDSLTISIGNETAELFHFGPAHTNADLVIYFPKQKVLHTGDLVFNNELPYIDWKAGSDTANWIAQLKEMQKWNIDKVIPGHGKLAGKEVLQAQMDYLIALRQAVADSIKKNESLDAMKKSISLPAYNNYSGQDVLPAEIEAVYHEMTAPATPATQTK